MEAIESLGRAANELRVLTARYGQATYPLSNVSVVFFFILPVFILKWALSPHLLGDMILERA